MKLKIPDFLTRDIVRKLIALVSAILIWIAVDKQLRIYETFHDVPVTLGYDQRLLTLERSVFVVNSVTIKGSRRRVQNVKSTDLRITAEIPGTQIPRGIHKYDMLLSPENVSSPAGTTVTEVRPAHIDVLLDHNITKWNVPVEVPIKGELRKGYVIVRTAVDPPKLDVRGPSRTLRRIDKIVTEPVVLDATLTQNFEVDVRLPADRQLDYGMDEVRLLLYITKESDQRQFYEVPVSVLGMGLQSLHVSSTLPEASFTIAGPKNILEKLGDQSVRAFVDISSITSPGSYRLPVQVWMPDGGHLSADRITPAVIEVTVTDKSAADEKVVPGKRPGPEPTDDNP